MGGGVGGVVVGVVVGAVVLGGGEGASVVVVSATVVEGVSATVVEVTPVGGAVDRGGVAEYGAETGGPTIGAPQAPTTKAATPAAKAVAAARPRRLRDHPRTDLLRSGSDRHRSKPEPMEDLSGATSLAAGLPAH
ncbi:MAG TPA: hypothetical protein VFP54_11670 [Acidimicrobiales bacterium]|nr:hypothetical protein [Acidimicrobiales bacterium]